MCYECRVFTIAQPYLFQTVLVFLTIVTSALQYVVHRLNYQRDLKRVEEVISQARSAAWGAKLTPAEGQRKVRYCRDSSVMGPSGSQGCALGQSESRWRTALR